MTHFHKKCLDRNGIYLIALLLIKFMYSTSICFNNDDEEYTQNSLLSIAWSSKLQVGIDWRNVTLDSSQTNVTVKYKLLNESYFSNITKLRSQNGLAIPGTSSYLKNNSVYIIMVNIGDCKMFTRYVLTGRKTLSTSNNAQDCRDGIYDFLLQPMPSLTWSYSAPSWTNNIPINKDALIDDTNGYKSINSFKQVYANFCIGMSQYNKTFSDGKWININSSPQNTLTKHFSITVQLNSFAYSILAMSGLQVTPSSSSNTNPYSGFNPSISPGNSFGGPNFKFGGMIKKQITGAGNNNNYYYMAMGINQVSGIFSAPIVGSFQITNENMATITGNISYKGYFFGYRAPISYINPNFNKGLSQCGNYSQGTCGKARYSNYCSITEEYADAFCELQPYCYIECPLPFPPINSRETTKSSFTIKWDNFDKSLMQNSSNFCGYTCMYKSSYSTVWLKNISALTTSYSVSDLSSFTTYNVRCKVEAYTMVVSDNYMLINITTNESEPTGEPRNFKGKVVWPSAFNFTWEEVDPSLRNGIVSTYQLICKNEENENSVFTFEFSDPALKGQALNLDYDTMYSCNLAACTAGGCGKKTDSISLKTLSSTPTIFPNVTYAHYINSTSMHIEWEDVDVQLWGVLENRMFCLVREEDGFAPIQNCVNYTTTKLDIHDLIPYTKYDFSVYCKNSRGSGPKDNKRVSAYTDEKAPDVYLLDMEAQEVGVNGLNFSWATPDLSDIHGNITGYTVTATAVISEEDYIPVEEPKERKRRSVGTSFYDGSLQINLVLTINDPSATSVWISDLFGYITYNISAAINNKYNGSFSNGIIVTTEEGTPVVSVLNLQCCDEDQDSITICWDEVPPLYLQGILKNYTVYYRMNDSSLVESIKQDSSETSLRIIMLLPVTKYVFNVTAWTDQGEGVPSGELTCETLEWYPDEEPTDVEVASLNYPNSALVTWEAIPLDDWMGIPAGYQISYKRIMEGVSQMTEDWMFVNSPSLNVSFTLLNLNVFSKYLLKVAGYTATGVGKYSDIVEFDTCLVEAPDVIVYYFENVPFVQSPVAPIKKPSGVMIEALEKSLLLCAQTCSSFKRNVTLIYRRLNISSTKDVINLTQTLKGAFMPILDPRSIIPGAEFVAIATSPGFVLLQVPDSPEVLLKQNEEIFLKTIINSMSVFILYFVINVLSGAIFFLCEPQSAEKRRVCYSLSGVFEGVYLAIMTSTTVGYGDKKPLSGKGRIFIIFWTLLGIVITGVCVGNVSSAISSAKLSAMKSHFPNEAVIGVEDSIEYEWASKKMVVDNTTKYFSYEEVVQSLESGAVKYAIFDQYAVEPFKQRLSTAGIFVAHTYANNFGKMGVVLTGKLSLLSTCVNQFIQANQKVVENALEKYKMNLATKAGNLSLPTNSSSREKYQPPDKNANLISFNAPLFRKFFISFLISLGALYFIGTIYELVRRRLLKSKSNRVKSTLELKLALKQDLLKLALEFEIEYAEMVEGLLKKTDDILFRHCKELLDLTKSCSKMYGVNFKYVNISDLGVPLDLIAEYREEMNNLPKVPWWIKFREAFFRKFLWLKIRIEPIGKFFYDLL